MVWIAAIGLLSAALAVRFISKSWLAPSSCNLALWSAYFVVPLILAPEYHVYPIGAWILVLLICCISIGSLLGEGPHVIPKSVSIVPSAKMFRASLLFSGIALIGVIYFANVELDDYSLETSLVNLFLVGHIHRVGAEDPPALVRLLVSFVFPAAMLGGMCCVFARTKWRRVLCSAYLLPAMIFSVLNAFRANTLIAVALWLAAYFSMRIAAGRPPRIRFGIVVKRVAVSAAILATFFFSIDAVRANEQDREISDPVNWARLKSTLFGHLPVFTYWCEHRELYISPGLTYGAYTFGGLADMIGVKHREGGVFQEFLLIDEDETTNVYTAFRGAVEDFTLLGAMLFLLLLGFGIGRLYHHVSLGHPELAPLLALAYAFLIWTPVISLLNYNGPLLGCLVALLLVRRHQRKDHRGRHGCTRVLDSPGIGGIGSLGH